MVNGFIVIIVLRLLIKLLDDDLCSFERIERGLVFDVAQGVKVFYTFMIGGYGSDFAE